MWGKMTSPNVTRMHEYLQAVASLGPLESVAAFFTPDVTFHEFPNRIAPHGRVRGAADLPAAYEQGRKILKSQSYRVQRVVEAGDEMAVELEWTGIPAVPVMDLPAGSEMNAFVAMFLTFREGKIAAQRNYDCYPPLGSSNEGNEKAVLRARIRYQASHRNASCELLDNVRRIILLGAFQRVCRFWRTDAFLFINREQKIILEAVAAMNTHAFPINIDIGAARQP
jgi:ketosteroid isomerase-like protein